MSREKTVDEVRKEFISHVAAMIRYWDTQVTGDTRCKLEGLAHSILAALDGCAGGLPGFIVAPCPHPDDKQYYIDEGENYYREINDDDICDIAGSLHEEIVKYYQK